MLWEKKNVATYVDAANSRWGFLWLSVMYNPCKNTLMLFQIYMLKSNHQFVTTDTMKSKEWVPPQIHKHGGIGRTHNWLTGL